MTTRSTGPARAAQAFTEASTWRQVGGRLAVLAPVHLALAWVASTSRLPEVPAGAVWPAAGVAALWISTASRRSLP
ncbi:hypothetical protein [Nocardioides daphniae]|uniref:Uncharacterized protein n=1 Tax=Nocardioides daphniae TaxID=402297 RepID=A0A4P7UCE3_9ACTN|nr:hypothetical protein [Nocardioides daphniae]QCC77686.1 hypothetical protein E2C04_11780 [Nocardioides daphniae]